MGKIKQRDIVLINFSPAKDFEQKGIRPAIVISGDAFHNSNLVIVCPLTSTIKNYKGNLLISPSQINGLKEKSEVMISQIRAVSTSRINKVFGQISDAELRQILEGFDLLCNR
jgi:mRNA interferase MazF